MRGEAVLRSCRARGPSAWTKLGEARRRRAALGPRRAALCPRRPLVATAPLHVLAARPGGRSSPPRHPCSWQNPSVTSLEKRATPRVRSRHFPTTACSRPASHPWLFPTL